jgi:hypothetical protein
MSLVEKTLISALTSSLRCADAIRLPISAFLDLSPPHALRVQSVKDPAKLKSDTQVVLHNHHENMLSIIRYSW